MKEEEKCTEEKNLKKKETENKSVGEQSQEEDKTDRNRQDKQRIERLLDKLTLFDDELMTSVFDKNIPATELVHIKVLIT